MSSPPSATLLPLLAALPFAASLLLACLPNRARRLVAWIAGLATLAGCALLFATAGPVFDGEVLRWSIEWLPTLGLELGFRIDGLAWLFALLILGIGALVVLYAAYYLHHEDPPARFFMFLMLFMGAMLGVVLADNLVLLVVFWELTSLASFLLIGYWSHRRDARQGARMALAITGGGGLCLLAGVLLLGHVAGSYRLDDVLAAGPVIREHPLYLPTLLLVLLGAFTKSAQFPFHFWLPHAMAAPTPVSAYLHSATMVKAGVFLLARLYPALGSTPEWFWLVTLTGLATLLVGAYLAIFEHDLKGLLAYSTISHLGLVTMLFGLDTKMAVVAGVFHILNHATFKASLFMSAGIIDHETGSRDMRRLNGLWKSMPVTGALGMVAAGSMAGVPLLNGFLSKEMFFAETVQRDSGWVLGIGLPLGATIAGIFSVAYSARFVHDTFFNGEPIDLPKTPHEPPRFMRVPVELLVLLCLAVGVAPAIVVGPLLAVAAQATLGTSLPDYSLAVWHGLNLPLAMSAVALVGGLSLYFGLQRRIDLHQVIHFPRGGREMFAASLAVLVAGARSLTWALQNGSLQRYLTLLVVFALAAGALPLLQAGRPAQPEAVAVEASLPVDAASAIVWAIGVCAAIATAIGFRRRLLALVPLGAVGLMVSLAFVHFSAPDLALTQILVEVVTIVLMMLALNWLPQESPPERHRLRRWRDAAIAAAAGLGVAAIAFAVLERPSRSISPYFLETSVPQGGGSNVVNVILVDYRGFDTLGEITVLGIAGIAIYALLAGFMPAPRTRDPGTATESDIHPLMLAVVSRLLLPLAALVSAYLFLRGHNLPGGGFIAGLVLAIALILQFVASGQRFVGARMRTDFRPWIGWGLLIAGGTGVGSWFFDAPFLTSSYDYPVWPVVGAVPLASAAVFDLGVYLTVVGATMVALVSIAKLGHAARGTR
ncbi:MAG TPA: monovalent cation/H+ antiporter subunit A [Burkholderiaceae bacterium]|nr:monovalent cation/H+ antiporter subunit A [Burkholderiaceae bacterium]